MKSKPLSTRPAPRLKPLVLSLALALGVGQAAHSMASDPRQGRTHDRYQQALLEQHGYPDGHPRAVMIAMARAQKPPERPAGALAVTNCNDDGPGSLRVAVESAVDGDTIDMSGLACSAITLSTGTLISSADSLSLIGPDDGGLIISGGNASPIMTHLGQGTLTLSDLTVANGRKYNSGSSDSFGGCVYSQGSVLMTGATAKYCTAEVAGTGSARGGAIYATGGILMIDSRITGSEALSVNSAAIGGGVFTPGSLTSKYSTLRNNSALATGTGLGTGGAAQVRGDAFIIRSTVSGNTADVIGGLDLIASAATNPLSISNSTISGNESLDSVYGAGVYLGEDADISNSTITGNVEANGSDTKYGGGITMQGGVTASLQSNIISDNSLFNGTVFLPSDIGDRGVATFGGSNNVIGQTPLTVPANNIRTVDPRLGPLASNGGPTQTHRPLKRSAAINAGNNLGDFSTDQRSTGFPRVIGAGTDAGSFETDTLFYNGLEDL